MSPEDESDVQRLEARLFGHDGQTGGVLGQMGADIADMRAKLDRWDGAITAVKVGAGLLGFGGLLTIIRAVLPPF